MQVKIRLQRFGSKKRPFYRVVAASSSEKRDGKFLDIVGLYHPIAADDSQIRLNEEKVKYWLERGATPTETVKDIFTKKGLWQDFAQKREAARAAGVKRKNAARKSKPAAKSAPAAPAAESTGSAEA